MSKYINKVTISLTKLISEISENPSLFVKNPKTDFTRNRKINFKKFIGITMNSGGGTMSKELLITNLNRSEFSTNDLKEIYHLRWGIETSFRELKYSIGLTSFHARKAEYIKQEVFARLLLYNYCELITTHVVQQMQNKDKTGTLRLLYTYAENISDKSAI